MAGDKEPEIFYNLYEIFVSKWHFEEHLILLLHKNICIDTLKNFSAQWILL